MQSTCPFLLGGTGISPSGFRSDQFIGVNDRDAWIAFEVARVEGKNSRDLMDLHCGDEPRVVCRLPRDVMGQREPLPLGEDVIRIRQNMKRRLILAKPSAAACGENPKPLTSRGRVATTQASSRLCFVTQSRLPCLKSVVIAPRARSEAGWSLSADLSRMFVSTRQSTPTTRPRARRCSRG